MSEAVASLYVGGHRPDFGAFQRGTARKVDLPTYPFQHHHYWFAEKRPDSAPGDAVRTETMRLLEEDGWSVSTCGLAKVVARAEGVPLGARRLIVIVGDAAVARTECRRRTGLAVEPMTCAPDAFRNGDGLTVLEPGTSNSGTWGIFAGAPAPSVAQ